MCGEGCTICVCVCVCVGGGKSTPQIYWLTFLRASRRTVSESLMSLLWISSWMSCNETVTQQPIPLYHSMPLPLTFPCPDSPRALPQCAPPPHLPMSGQSQGSTTVCPSPSPSHVRTVPGLGQQPAVPLGSSLPRSAPPAWSRGPVSVAAFSVTDTGL